MFPGETISTGAPPTCEECKETPKLEVYKSPGSGLYYIGTYCFCGPYSRESEYIKDRKRALEMLAELNSDPAKNTPDSHPMLRQP